MSNRIKMFPIRSLGRLLGGEKGGTIVFTGLTLAGMLAIMGLVIDGGTLFVTKTQLQQAANAAALSGAQELTNSSTEVTKVVQDVLHRHGETNSMQTAAVDMGRKVKVELERNVKLGFSGLFGMKTAPVQAQAAAELRVMGRADGAAPLGIDDSIPLEYNKTYKLKVDQTEVSYGNFGILALGGSGASTYEDNLKHGYQHELKIGDILDTQTGNIAGKTRSSVQERINLCPYTPGDTSHRDCPRILLVPVYTPYDYNSNQLKHVKVTGFAYFYITEPMSSKDTSITGMFIRRADTGFAAPGALDKGAYAIKLTE